MSKALAGFQKLAKKFILSSPKSVAEAIWRGTALWMLTIVGSLTYLMATERELLYGLISESSTPLYEVIAKQNKREEVVELVGKFAQQAQPLRIALVAKTSDVGVSLVWSSEGLQKPWPTSIDGVMSDNIKPIYGHIVLDECWHGQFESSPNWYVLCGISDDDRSHVGFLIAEKEKPCETFKADFERLARRISEILF